MSAARRDITALPAPEAVRTHARALVRRTRTACRRLGDAKDKEALHDFRVALRRLRSHLRAYRAFHGVGRKAERRLKALARRTNRARDAEVASTWLAARRTGLEAHEAAGADRLAACLQAEREAASPGGGAEVAARWNGLARDLARRLGRDPGGAGGEPFARVAAACLGAHAERLRARLAAVREVTDQAEAHQARIAAKRLRYLLEPLVGQVDGADAATRDLAELQDTLGAMHDMEGVIARLGDALRQAVTDRADRRLAAALGRTPDAPKPGGDAADPEPGLLRLAALAARDRADRFQTLREGCLADGGAGLLASVERVRATLDPPAPNG